MLKANKAAKAHKTKSQSYQRDYIAFVPNREAPGSISKIPAPAVPLVATTGVAFPTSHNQGYHDAFRSPKFTGQRTLQIKPFHEHTRKENKHFKQGLNPLCTD